MLIINLKCLPYVADLFELVPAHTLLHPVQIRRDAAHRRLA